MWRLRGLKRNYKKGNKFYIIKSLIIKLILYEQYIIILTIKSIFQVFRFIDVHSR